MPSAITPECVARLSCQAHRALDHVERRSAHLFFQLVARRYEKGSLLVTTNQPVTQWGAVFGDEMTASAILDRLLHHSYTMLIQGESYRLRQKKRAALVAPATRS